MADPFNEMKKLDDERIARDVRLLIDMYRSTGQITDAHLRKMERALYTLAKSNGTSEKGAKAWASLKMLDVKKALDPKR